MTQPAKHTPGPWVVNADGRMIEAQLPNLRNEYEHICDLRGGIKGQINLANAALIAAAPAMYEAGKPFIEASNLFEVIDDGGGDRYVVTVTKAEYAALRAALAQAEGK